LVSSLDGSKKEELLQTCNAKAGDLILFALGESSAVNKTLDWLRRYIAEQLSIIDEVLFPLYVVNIVC
jgi:aspartyl-tRNA synthetase